MSETERPLNIVLYANSYLPTIGGRELVVHHLAQALIALGHGARVVGPSGWWRQRRLRFDYPVHRWPTLRGLLRNEVLWTQLLLDTAIWGCDVVHAHNTYPGGYTALRLKKVRNYPLVITPHGADIHTIPEIGHGLRLDPELEPKIRAAVQGAELLTAISGSVENSLLEAGARKENIRSIPNGVDIERFRTPAPDAVYDWLKLPPESRLIVTVGKYNPRKGQQVMVRAMPLILEQVPAARLVIVGQLTEALEPLIAELGLQGKVVLTGGIPPPAIVSADGAGKSTDRNQDRLASLLAASEIYVSAGIDEGAEGLSLAVLEAMAAGTPVVATDISGNRDIVFDGQNGFLVPPADEQGLARGVVRMLQNDELRLRMKENARSVASQYSWTSVASMYVDVYREAREKAERRKGIG